MRKERKRRRGWKGKERKGRSRLLLTQILGSAPAVSVWITVLQRWFQPVYSDDSK